ncbi:MAG: DUF4825 domain-containing protein [Niameybacter sp.]
MIIVAIMVMLFCVSCQPKNDDSSQVKVSSYAQQLFLDKNPYIGDASANGKVLNLLNMAEELGSYSVELKTDEIPYWIKLNFEEYVSDREAFDLKLLDKAFLILALIENANEVQCSYPYIEDGEEILITLYVTQKQATDALGKDIKAFAKSEAGIQTLLNQLTP